MRGRWRVINEIWEARKGPNNQLDLLQQLDYMGKLSSQLASSDEFRLVYTTSGRPTAAVLTEPDPLVDYTLFRVPCESLHEARYLCAVINSRTLENAVETLMPKGQFGARHLVKHLWRLPIPAYDPTDGLHREIADSGTEAAGGAADRFAELRVEREVQGKATSVTVVRRELRAWLEQSAVGRRIDGLVERLLATNGG